MTSSAYAIVTFGCKNGFSVKIKNVVKTTFMAKSTRKYVRRGVTTHSILTWSPQKGGFWPKQGISRACDRLRPPATVGTPTAGNVIPPNCQTLSKIEIPCPNAHRGSPPPATACDRLRPLRKFSYTSSASITHTLPPSLPRARLPFLFPCSLLPHKAATHEPINGKTYHKCVLH